MEIALHNPGRKVALIGTCLFLCTAYLSFCTRGFLAEYFSNQPDLLSLERAVALQPTNASYWHVLGRYHLFVDQEPSAAIPMLRAAVKLNPHDADYWLDLSTAYQVLGEKQSQMSAIQRAVAANPRSPDIAWQAANLYWAEGDGAKALGQFRIVAENDPYLVGAVLERCWRIQPDASLLLANVLPRRADIYSVFLELLISKNQAAAAATIWTQLAELQAPVSRRYVFEYVHYLIDQKEVGQARRVWRDAADLADLSGYQPSGDNFVVNNDFSMPVLNGGFDWLYQKMPGVTLAIDPVEAHSGPQSLLIDLDSSGMEDAGIRQLIPVEANTTYDFSAYFKSENIEGAGGPRFLLQDAFSGTTYFTSDDLKDADFWKETIGSFTTAADAKLVVLRVGRVPANNAIRGKLWIGGLRVAKHRSAAGVS
ncbi:MAG TPA: hypothetical protein VEI26_11970 [Terriglobales bacterium]|nr:hypothetical protein [Terriglobales bacterium]